MSGWTFHTAELDREDVQNLLSFHFANMRSNSPPEACHVLPGEELTSADITFWSLRENDKLLGVGALKELAADHGEIKSMRTASSALGRGVGTAVLRHIVAEARLRGYSRLSLETGSTEPFIPALRLYQREGFAQSAPFGGYPETPFTRFFALNL